MILVAPGGQRLQGAVVAPGEAVGTIETVRQPFDAREVSLVEIVAACAALGHGVCARAAWPGGGGGAAAQLVIAVLAAGALLTGLAAALLAALVLEVSPRSGPALRGSAWAGALAAGALAAALWARAAGRAAAGGSTLLAAEAAAGLPLLAALTAGTLLCGVRVARAGGRRFGLTLVALLGLTLAWGADGGGAAAHALRVGLALPGLWLLLVRWRAGERWVLGAPLPLLVGVAAGLALGRFGPAVLAAATAPAASLALQSSLLEHELGLLVLALAGLGLYHLLRARAWWPAALLAVAAASSAAAQHLLGPTATVLPLLLAALAGIAIAQLPRRLGIAAPAASAALAGMIMLQPLLRVAGY